MTVELETVNKLVKEYAPGCWRKDTCYKPLQSMWTDALPELGQCGVTTLFWYLIRDGEKIGDLIYHSLKFNHFWLLDKTGKLFDITHTQFSNFGEIDYQNGKLVPQSKLFQDADLVNRTVKLARRFLKELRLNETEDIYTLVFRRFSVLLAENSYLRKRR